MNLLCGARLTCWQLWHMAPAMEKKPSGSGSQPLCTLNSEEEVQRVSGTKRSAATVHVRDMLEPSLTRHVGSLMILREGFMHES